MLNLVLVSERVNAGGGATLSSAWSSIYDDAERYYKIMTRHGAFHWYDTPAGNQAEDRCWRRLASVLGNCPIVSTMNLLKPSSLSGSWQRLEAELAAGLLLRSAPRPAVLIACGTRVARAIYSAGGQRTSYPLAPGAICEVANDLWYTRIPHPSGRNPQYHNAELIQEIRERFQRNLALLQGGPHDEELERSRSNVRPDSAAV